MINYVCSQEPSSIINQNIFPQQLENRQKTRCATLILVRMAGCVRLSREATIVIVLISSPVLIARVSVDNLTVRVYA